MMTVTGDRTRQLRTFRTVSDGILLRVTRGALPAASSKR